MRTTIEIAASLLAQAREVAAREETTLKELVQEGLRASLDKRRARPRFHLRKASFRGKGLRPAVAEGSWERIRELVYEGRGA